MSYTGHISDRSRPLSYQHLQARDRHQKGDSLPNSIALAIDEVDQGEHSSYYRLVLLESERPKVVAEAAAMFIIRTWAAFLSQQKKDKQKRVGAEKAVTAARQDLLKAKDDQAQAAATQKVSRPLLLNSAPEAHK